MILEGERIYLRPIRESDIEDFCTWYGDSEVTHFLGMKPMPRSRAEAMFNQLMNDSNGVYFSIVEKTEERTIGYVFLAGILKNHRVAREFGIVIGDRNLWSHGYGSESTRIMLEYGFKNLKLHRIELLALDFNERALRMYRKLGFVEEGVQREARLIDGEWHNVIIMSMLEREFK